MEGIGSEKLKTMLEKEKFFRKEKAKARKLRQSQWWRNKLNEGVCHYCGGKFDREQLNMDHIVPISRGGKSVKGNVVLSCKKCNYRGLQVKHYTK